MKRGFMATGCVRHLVLSAVAALGAAVFAANAGAATHNTCPPPPPPGSTVNGGLLVTGPCTLNHVTVNGGATVTSTGHLELENSTVNGGVNVHPGGEFDSGHTIASDTATFLPSTINGGISSTGMILDMDLDNATVNGHTTISGNAPGFAPTICGSTLHGGLTVQNIVDFPFFPTRIGDPGEPFQVGPHPDCPGNSISGSVMLTNDRFLELEGNTISGSVFVTNSTVEISGNKISGQVKCNGATFFTDGDPAPPNPCS